jgi:hypothetical protein
MIKTEEAELLHEAHELPEIAIPAMSNLESRAFVTVTREDYLLAIAEHYTDFMNANLPVYWDFFHT